jgi:hypothetical protein
MPEVEHMLHALTSSHPLQQSPPTRWQYDLEKATVVINLRGAHNAGTTERLPSMCSYFILRDDIGSLIAAR